MTIRSGGGRPKGRPEAIEVRLARGDDLMGIIGLLTEAEEHHARVAPRFFRRSSEASVAAVAAERLATARRRDESLFVALRGDALCGLARLLLRDTPPEPALAPRRRGYLDELVVARAARRSGVGRRLVQSASEWAAGRGAEELLLTVWSENRIGQRFYRSLGFAPISAVLGRPL